MSDMKLEQANRQGVIPLIGIYSLSGNGKTMSSLLMARGIVGETGTVGMIDTEAGRGSLYAEEIPGGYNKVNLATPFTSDRYMDAIRVVENSCDIGIMDSATHAWEDEGGVLEQADKNKEKSGKPGVHNWTKPKMENKRMLHKIKQSRIPWIICLRAHYKTRQTKIKGKTQIRKDDVVTAIQDDDFVFEMTIHGWLDDEHKMNLTKCPHPDIRDCFPDGPITVETGKAIAEWCKGGKSKPKPKKDGVAELKKKLWKLLQNSTGKGKNLTVNDAEQYVWNEELMADDTRLKDLGISAMKDIINELEGTEQ